MAAKIASFIGLLAIVAACYIGYAHPTVAGRELPAAVGSWFDSILPPDWKQKLTGGSKVVTDAKDSSELLETIPDLYVPCGFIVATSLYTHDPDVLDRTDVNPIPTVLDPTIPMSTISRDTVMQDRYLQLIFEDMGDSKYIPEGSLYLRMGSLEATLPCPQFLVVDDDPNSMYKIRLGRNFMKENQARIDLDEMELYITIGDKPNVMIPFLKIRSSPDLGGSDEL